MGTPGASRVHIICDHCGRERVLTDAEFSMLTVVVPTDELRRRLKCTECGRRGAIFMNVWHAAARDEDGEETKT
jgi:hypothetical protein